MDTNYNAYNYLKAIGHNWANEKYNPLLYYIKEAIEHGFKQSK